MKALQPWICPHSKKTKLKNFHSRDHNGGICFAVAAVIGRENNPCPAL